MEFFTACSLFQKFEETSRRFFSIRMPRDITSCLKPKCNSSSKTGCVKFFAQNCRKYRQTSHAEIKRGWPPVNSIGCSDRRTASQEARLQSILSWKRVGFYGHTHRFPTQRPRLPSGQVRQSMSHLAPFPVACAGVTWLWRENASAAANKSLNAVSFFMDSSPCFLNKRFRKLESRSLQCLQSKRRPPANWIGL